MRTPAKIAIAVGTLAVLLLAVLVVVPWFYRDRIAERVKTEINRSVDAEVDWGGVGLSVVRSFPNLTLRLDDFSVTGVERFAGDTLAAVGRFQVVLDLASVVRGLRSDEPIVVRAIELHRPVLHLRVLEDGTANWEIARQTPEARAAETTRPLAVSLQRFEIRDATVVLDNRPAELFASLTGFRQSLTGDFRQERFLLRTRAGADALSVRFAGVPYLNRVELEVEADLDADLANGRFTFQENQLRLNDLRLAFAGAVGVTDDRLDLDLTFDAPRTDFRHILSLVPALYARDFQTLQTTGAMAVSGRVQGAYGEDAFPGFALRATVDNGSFRYPDLPLPARDIFVTLAVDNPGGDVDHTVVNLERFQAVIGSDPIRAALLLRTPISDPDVDLRLAGRLDLADLGRTVKLEGVEELAGVVTADVTAQARRSFLDSEQYDRVTARGSAEVRSLALRTADLPHAIEIDEAQLQFAPQHAELRSFRGRIGSSDLQLTGYLDNLVGFVLRDEELRGRANLSSAHFDLNEWQTGGGELEVIPVPANLDVELQAAIARLSYGPLEMTDVRGAVRVQDQRLSLDDLAMKLLGGELAVSGYYETTDVDRPTFDTRLRIRSVEIPAAFASLTTVQLLAPVARYAQGHFSAELGMRGALGKDMMPLFEVLNGQGSLETSRLELHQFPAMNHLAELLKLEQLRNPVLEGVRSFLEIRDGRLHVRPFEVGLGESRLNVAGSQGIDQSLQYALRLRLPRSLLGAETNRAVAALVSQVGRTGIDLQAAEEIELGFQLTGTVTNPLLQADAAGAVSSLRDGVEQAVRQEVDRRVEEVGQRVDEAAEEARRRARAEAERLIQEAEQRAALVREEAQRLAETTRQQGNQQADALVERANTPLARTAARPAADRLRREADEKAEQILREADRRADALVAEARQRAGETPEPER